MIKDSKSFVNTLPYISNPIEEFSDFKFVSWEKEIYPKFKGEIDKEEIKSFVDLIIKHKLKKILDLGVGGGTELTGILEMLKEKNYSIENVEANEVDNEFIKQSSKLFSDKGLKVLIHKTNWLDLLIAATA